MHTRKRITKQVLSMVMLLALLVSAQVSEAGWSDITPSNSINTLFGIWGTSPTNIYAVGLNGLIFHYDGTTWTSEDSGTTNKLYAVWGVSETNIYAVGDKVMLHKTGVTWDPIELKDYKNEESWANETFVSIRGADTNHIYAGTDNGAIFFFDGTGWTEMDYPGGTNPVSGIWPFSSSNVYVSRAPEIYGTIHRYDGNKWEKVFQGKEQTNLHAVWASSPSDIYAVGAAGEIIHCTGNCNDEEGWQLITPNATTKELNAIYGSSSSNIIAVGSEGTIVHSAGAGFTATPFNTIKDFFGVWVSPDGLVAYAVGSDGIILKWEPDPATTTTTITGGTTTTIPGGVTTTVPGGTTTTAPGGVTTSIVPPGEVGADFIGSPLSVRVGMQVQFTNLSGGDITSYSWNFGDGGVSIEKNPSHVYQKRGIYSVILTVTGGDNNSKTAQKQRDNYITVKSKCAIVTSLDNSTQIEALRAARDAGLNDLSGIVLTSIYYRNSSEVSAVFKENPALCNRFKQLVTDNNAVLENLLQVQPASVTPAAVADVVGYLEDLKAEGSLSLQYDIDFVIMGIRSRFLLDGLGITVQ